MNGQYWDPLREMESMLRGRNAPSASSSRGHEAMTSADWSPAVDIAETKDEYLINVELTEIAKDNVNVSASDGVLIIQGQRLLEQPEGIKYHRVERGHGKFARSFNLPDDVEPNQIRAEQREGMLYLHLPKHKEPPPRAIKIDVQ